MRYTEAAAAIALQKQSLAARIAGIGIQLPDQQEALRMMEVTRLGLAPIASRVLVERVGIWRRLFKLRYTVFGVEEFNGEPRLYGNNGGKMPEAAKADAKKIKDLLPEVVLEVHAMYDDPWLLALSGSERVIVRGWYREDRFSEPRIIA